MTGPDTRWELRKSGDDTATEMDAKSLGELIAMGIVGAGHQVRPAGMSQWLSVDQASVLLNSGTAAASAEPEVPTQQPQKTAKPSEPRQAPKQRVEKPSPRSAKAEGTKATWRRQQAAASQSAAQHASFPATTNSALPTQHPRAASDRPPLREDDDDELDITPMIDMTFLLLIFFMVTSTISPFAELQLPEAKSGDAQKPEGRVVLVLDYDAGHEVANPESFTGSDFIELKDCKIYLADDNQNTIAPEDLTGILSDAFAKSTSGEFILQCNRKMPVGVVREVIKQAQTAGAGHTMIGVARPR